MASRLDAWQVAASTTLSFGAISAGTDRILVVVCQQESSGPSQPTDVTYGDQSLTHVGSVTVSTINENRIDIFVLLEAGIAAASGTNITWTSSDDPMTAAVVYEDCVQSTGDINTSMSSATATSSTPNPITSVTRTPSADNAVVIAIGNNGDIETATWANITERFDQSRNFCSFSGADVEQTTAAAVNPRCTWSAQQRASLIAFVLEHQGLAITGVDTDEIVLAGQQNVVTTGTEFGPSQGSGKIEIGDSATYGSANLVELNVDSWSDTSIQADIPSDICDTVDPGAAWVYVTNDSAERSSAFPITLFRAVAWVLSASTHIAASGENTTARLTAPSGKTTGDFGGGRIQDDENPSDSVDIGEGKYGEWEFCIASTASAVVGTPYELDVLINGEVAGTVTVTPTVTLSAGTTVNLALAAEDDSAFDLTLTPGALTVNLDLAQEDDTALDVGVSSVRTVNLDEAQEVDTAFDVTPAAGAVTVDLAEAQEDDTAFDVDAQAGALTVDLAEAQEDDTAFDVSVNTGGATVNLDLAQEDDTAFDVTPAPGAVTVDLAEAQEDDTAFDVTIDTEGRVNLDLAQELDEAFDLTLTAGAVTVNLPIVQEDDTALDLTVTSVFLVNLALAQELDEAFDLTLTAGAVTVNLDHVQEEDVAYPLFLITGLALEGVILDTQSAEQTRYTMAPALPLPTTTTTEVEPVESTVASLSGVILDTEEPES